MSTEIKPGYKLRKLQSTDYSKGYLQLLSQLTTVTEISQQKFDEILGTYGTNYCAVIEDSEGCLIGQINANVSTGTVVIQQKFIRGGGKVGFIEGNNQSLIDIVIGEKARGTGLGKLLIQHLISVGKDLGCYKVQCCSRGRTVVFRG